MKKGLLIIFLCFAALSAQAQEMTTLQDTIPFRNDLGLIIIPISFNGVEKQFAFDTGAQKTVVFSWAKDELKRTSKKISVTSSNGSKTKMCFYKSGIINLGSKEIKKHSSIMAGDSSIFTCHNVDGILGVDIIKHFNWIINYETKQVVMFDKTYVPPSADAMNSVAFSFEKNRPTVAMTLDDKKIEFLLDTGAGDSDLNMEKYPISNLDKFSSLNGYGGFYDVNGTLTRTKSTEIQLPNMMSDGVTLTPIVAYGSKTTKIGNSLWENTTLFLSLTGQKLLVSQNKIKENTNGYSCGVAFSDGMMRVMAIYEGSAAWEAGVRQGDEVMRFNDKVFTDFCSFDQYQRDLSSSGEDITLELKGGEKIVIKEKTLFETVQ